MSDKDEEEVHDVVKFGFGVANILARKHWAAQESRPIVSLDELVEKGLELPATAPPHLDDADESFEEERNAVRQCLEELNPEDRALVVAYYAEGKNKLNRAALMQSLQLTADALYQRTTRVRQQVRECAKRRLGPAARQENAARRTL